MDTIIDIETTGLEPIKNDNRILAIGICGESGTQTIFADRDESKMINEFWSRIANAAFKTTFVGFNIYEFDLYFLLMRSLKHSIKVPQFEALDLRKVLAFKKWHKATGGTLTDYTTALGLNGFPEDHLDGSKMPELGELWLKGDDAAEELIKSHLQIDLEKTRALYNRIKQCGLLPYTQK